MKKLYRSRTNKTFAGIFGGLGEYFGIDPVILRVAYLIITIFTLGLLGVIAYLLMILVIPYNPDEPEYIAPGNKR